jgi:4-alpha-glucanotransferase
MLACNFTPGETPSPYSPISRLFWNEFYLDVDAIPELKSCVAAQTITASSGFQDEIVAVRRAPKCEYSRIMSLKRRVLELLAKGLFSNPSKRRAAFETYLARHPRLRDFAAFRAAAEQHGPNWRRWPAAPREGTLSAGDFDPDVQRYHMYVQWIAHEQMSALSQNSAGLYLDLPLGVNPDGYDVWRERDSFVPGVAVGAPPDNLFLGGQNWGFPPLHPGVSREHAHHHLKAVLRHHMHHAKMLRIDHVMGLHRLYWVPDGMAATDGVYVNQAHDELYAILCLESQRHGTVIVGEDLGTVPGFVRESMDTHGLHRMYIAQFDLRADSNHAIGPVVPGSVASLNTHDTPTFAGFCSGRDIDDLVDLGLIDPAGAPGMHAHRAAQVRAAEIFLHARGLIAAPGDRAALVRGLIQFLADSEAMTVLVNLEDLWLEPVPHNVPGTVNERPNWRRKTRISLDEMEASPAVLEPLKQMGLALKGQ